MPSNRQVCSAKLKFATDPLIVSGTAVERSECRKKKAEKRTTLNSLHAKDSLSLQNTKKRGGSEGERHTLDVQSGRGSSVEGK